ncbi:MAG: hypothetical protein KDL87_02375 [Verrucomicrobiae bacterium]|nr:hypothetical protein [Verrucomicrobiae bacterium]
MINAYHSLRLLSLALVDSGTDKRDLAFSHIQGTLRAIRHGTDYPGLPSLTIRTLALESAGLEPIWQALYRQRFSDAQWEAIDRELTEFDFGPRFLRTLRYERSVLIRQVERGFRIRSRQPFQNPPAWIDLAGLHEAATLTQRYWFSAPKGLRPLTEWPRIDQLETVEAIVDQIPTTDENLIVKLGVQPVSELARQAQTVEIARDLARIAISLERHRLATGTLPGSLSELTPKWLSEIPANVETGHPPRFEKQEEGNGYRLRNLGDQSDGNGPIWQMPLPAPLSPEVASPS